MTDCISLPWEISLQQRALQKLAEHFWGTFVLRELNNEEEISISCKRNALITHRDIVLKSLQQVLCYLSTQLSFKLPELIISEVINAIFNLQRGYYEALIWENKYTSFLPLTILNPITAGKYQASYFIDTIGHFNDLDWVKLYVTDEQMDAYSRFKMACFYCLEDVLPNIWNSIESEKRDPFVISTRYEGSRIQGFDNLVFFWACKVANYFGEPDETKEDIEKKLDALNTSSLYLSASAGYEYAVRYFWTRCSASQKDIFIQSFRYDSMNEAARKNFSGILHFLYILLSQEHRNTQFFMENMQFFESDMGKIWYCLLDSQFYKCTLHDILKFRKKIPNAVYLDIFRSLTFNIEIFNYPIQKIIFKKLWSHFPEKERLIIGINSLTISTFIKLKEIDLVEAIIKPLSYNVKDTMLLYDLQGAGTTALYELSKVDDYDTMFRYLCLFLLDQSSCTKKLRVNANGILETLQNGVCSKWSGVDDLAKQRTCETIRNLNECLNVLSDVLNKLEESPKFDF